MKKILIEELLIKIESGKDVSRRRLFRAIGTTALARMEREWREEVRTRDYKPPKILEYSKRLNRALRKHMLAERCSARRSPKAKRMFEVAEAAFEDALQYLSDVLSGGSDLRLWIDRGIDFNDLDFGLSPSGMPRPIWSKSPHFQGRALPKRTIRDFKRDALIEALEKHERRNKRAEVPTLEQLRISMPSARSRLQKHDYSDWKF